jgi:protein phosphatase
MNLTAFSLNEIGGRKNVEDAIMPKQYSRQSPKLFVVCDGVGGSSFGEVASELATKNFYTIFEKATVATEADFTRLLHQSLAAFQKEVQTYITQNPSAAGTSTTLTLLLIQQQKAWVAWCGDSKIFQIRNGKPVYRSRDHSLVAELVEQGVITEKEAESHPQRNIITRSLSANTKPTDIETAVMTDLQDQDWFLLCTDGLMEQFTESLFPSMLGNFVTGKNYSAEIDKICKGKTKDNYSMYLIHLSGVKKKGAAKWLLPLIIVILAAGGWFGYRQISKENKTTEASPVTDTTKEEPEVKSIMMVRPQSADDTAKTKPDSTKKDSIK